MEILECRWRGPGISGGNCWDEGGHYSDPGDEEPEFEELYNYLEEKAPTLSFLHFKHIEKNFVEREHKEYREYYGNHSSEYFKRVNVKILDEYLKEKGYV